MHNNNASLGLITSININIPPPKSDLLNIVSYIIQRSLKRDAFYLVQQRSLKKSLKQQFKMKNVKLKHKSALWLLENGLNRCIRNTCRRAFSQLSIKHHTNETTCSVSNSQLVTPKTSSKKTSYEERRLRQLSYNQNHQQISQLEMILLLLILLLMKVYQK